MASNYPTTRAGWAAWHLQWGIDHNDPPETIQRLRTLADKYRATGQEVADGRQESVRHI